MSHIFLVRMKYSLLLTDKRPGWVCFPLTPVDKNINRCLVPIQGSTFNPHVVSRSHPSHHTDCLMSRARTSQRGSPEELFSDPLGDFYLCSTADNQVFRVSRGHLAYASEVFRDMFATHQASGHSSTSVEGTSSCPLQLDVSSDVLDEILHIIYATGHNSSMLFAPIDLYRRCLLFADKYIMEGVTRIARPYFQLRAYESPVQAYLMARKLGWTAEARGAKVVAMSIDIWPLVSTTTIEINNTDCSPFLIDLLAGMPLGDACPKGV
jgi:hypothetical protein